jgi:hypothetical protein
MNTCYQNVSNHESGAPWRFAVEAQPELTPPMPLECVHFLLCFCRWQRPVTHAIYVKCGSARGGTARYRASLCCIDFPSSLSAVLSVPELERPLNTRSVEMMQFFVLGGQYARFLG